MTRRDGKPKVSVTVVTYNHGEWLAMCLESIVTQKTDFEFEVIVGDDASTDNRTVEVLREYQTKYPDLIVPIFRKKNIGPVANFFDVMRRARGQYLAHIDGDDIMFSGKLQAQVDFLDANAGFSMAVHRMSSLCPDGSGGESEAPVFPEVGTVDDLLKYGCYFCHSSKMYRRSAIITSSSALPLVDYFLHIEHAISGLIYFDRNVLGGHRLHPQGMSASEDFRVYVQQGYERAFDRALELGLDRLKVERGRLRHRQAVALSMLAVGDFDAFKEIALSDSEKMLYASPRQRLVFFFANSPFLAAALQQLSQRVKNAVRLLAAALQKLSRRVKNVVCFLGLG